MESKTLLAVLLVGLLSTARSQPQQPLVYDTLEEPQGDRQVASILLGLITPTLTNLLTMGATNLASAVYNAISATFAGKQLELIPLESLLATPIRETAAPAPASQTYTPGGGEPLKRRPYTRAMDLNGETPLQSSEAKPGSSP